MSAKHNKHPKISRLQVGEYHKNEFGIYGTNCNKIKAFYDAVSVRLADKYRMSYVDADHGEKQSVDKFQSGVKQFYSPLTEDWNQYDDRIISTSSDVVFVNGNHFPAAKQLVILDEEKRDSLHRRIDQLTDVICIIKKTDDQDIYPFLADKIQDSTVILSMDKMDEIITVIKENISPAPLKALILAGGESKRMGKDKSQLNYHGEAQEIYLAKLLQSKGIETFISKGINYNNETVDRFPVIKDRLREMGPFGAILSGFMYDISSAWLVIACDLPLLNEEVLDALLSRRKSDAFATAYRLASQPFPEPLIAIYEPKIYNRMLQFLSIGYACPRKVLINTAIEEIVIHDEILLMNVNTPQDKELAENKINKR